MAYDKLYKEMTTGTSHLIIDGPAGSGKSFLIEQYRRSQSPETVLVTATTGIAAQRIYGQTIHALLGYRRKKSEIEDAETALPLSTVQVDAIRRARTLIIDEVSMLNCEMMDWIDKQLQRIRKDATPFGGMRLILVGDHYQLLPVGAGMSLPTPYLSPYLYFQAKVFQEKVFTNNLLRFSLTKNFRQAGDKKLRGILDRIRVGNVEPADLKLLNKRLAYALYSPSPFVCLTNEGTHNWNDMMVSRLGYPVIEIPRLGNDGKAIDGRPLRLALNAQVIMTKNNFGEGYQNGTPGQIAEITMGSDKYVESLTIMLNTGAFVKVKREFWEAGRFDASQKFEGLGNGFMQFPVRLAYAFTSHRAQGMTLEQMSVIKDTWNFRSMNPFQNEVKPHQMYTLLSRVPRVEGLFIQQPILAQDFIVDPNVSWYMSLFEKDSEAVG